MQRPVCEAGYFEQFLPGAQGGHYYPLLSLSQVKEREGGGRLIVHKNEIDIALRSGCGTILHTFFPH